MSGYENLEDPLCGACGRGPLLCPAQLHNYYRSSDARVLRCGNSQQGATEDYGTMSIFERDRTFAQPINWVTSSFIAAFHVGGIIALFFFTWKALALAILLSWVVGSLGIGMGYHRLLTHRGYKTPKWMEYFLTVCGTLALEGGPIAWVATHRVHHQNTDKEGDPHSPRDGGLWDHVGWILTGEAMHSSSGELLPFVPDLRKDKFQVWISKWRWIPLTVLGLAAFAIGLYAMWLENP